MTVPMSLFAPFRVICLWLIISILIAGSIVTNILQIVILPVDLLFPALTSSFHSIMADRLMLLLEIGFEKINNIEIQVTGDKIPQNESAIIISNHLGAIDFLLHNVVSSRAGKRGDCKYFIKYSSLFIPIFGLIMYFLGFIFLNRNWQSDRKYLQKQFSFIKNSKKPIWLMLFPEGTRYSLEKVKSSQDFSKENNLPVLDNVLYPRTKGFIETVQSLRKSHVTHVYDFTLAIHHQTKGFAAVPPIAQVFLFGVSGYKCMIHVKRYAIAHLPESDEELGQWAKDRFHEKDLFLEELKNKWKE